jgi:hypothetical protein
LPKIQAECREAEGFDLKIRYFTIGIHFSLATNITSSLEQKANIHLICMLQDPRTIPLQPASNIKIAHARSKTAR